MTVSSSLETSYAVANSYLGLIWSGGMLNAKVLATGEYLFQNAGCRISLYNGKSFDFFSDPGLEINQSDGQLVFRGKAGPLSAKLSCLLADGVLQLGLEVTNRSELAFQLGDICPLIFEKARGGISHLLSDPCDVFSLGAATGETGEVWSKENGNKRVFALRLDATEPWYVTDNLLALRPEKSGILSREITYSFDRIGEVAAGFSVDLREGISFARGAYRGALLLPGETRVLPVLTVDGIHSVDHALDAATERVAEIYKPSPSEHVPSGWCSWYYYYSEVKETDILENLRFLAANRERFPCDYIQIDDGYQLHWGDWLLPGKKFDHDMAWLAREIKALGFKPGIWVAPMIMTAQSNLYRDHPDWALKYFESGAEQSMKGWSPPEENPWIILDGTNPEFLAHIRKVFSIMAHEWGYDYFKLDATGFGAYAGVRHDPSKTGVQAVRMVMETIREAVGPGKYILGCGLPFGAAVGVVDGERVSDDVSTVFRAGEGYCPIAVAMPQSIHRSFVHRKWWHNDPDCVLVRSQGTPHNDTLNSKGMSLEEARFFITIVGLTQGVQMLGENMMMLEEERLALLDAIQPMMPVPARPLDLFSSQPEQLLTVLPQGSVLGLLNWGREPKTFSIKSSGWDWPDSESFQAYELWTGSFLDQAEAEALEIGVPAEGARVLLLRPRRNHPTFLGFDGHISCGASLLKSETWDAEEGTLSIEFLANRSGKISLLLPEEWIPAGSSLIRSPDGAWILAVSAGLHLLRLEFHWVETGPAACIDSLSAEFQNA